MTWKRVKHCRFSLVSLEKSTGEGKSFHRAKWPGHKAGLVDGSDLLPGELLLATRTRAASEKPPAAPCSRAWGEPSLRWNRSHSLFKSMNSLHCIGGCHPLGRSCNKCPWQGAHACDGSRLGTEPSYPSFSELKRKLPCQPPSYCQWYKKWKPPLWVPAPTAWQPWE